MGYQTSEPHSVMCLDDRNDELGTFWKDTFVVCFGHSTVFLDVVGKPLLVYRCARRDPNLETSV